MEDDDSRQGARSLLANSIRFSFAPFDNAVGSDEADYVSKVSSCLDASAIERHNGEIVRNIRDLQESGGPQVSVQLARYLIYLSSNNLLMYMTDDPLS